MLLIVHDDGTYFEFDPQRMRVVSVDSEWIESNRFDEMGDGARWVMAQRAGRQVELVDPYCSSVYKDYVEHACAKPFGHDGVHRCAYDNLEWSDSDVR